MGQLWGTDSLGGYMYSDKLSSYLRTNLQPMTRFRQFCDAEDATELGEHSGANFRWNVYSDVADSGGALVESLPMPETNFTISQGTLTVTEYGNSVPYTGKLDDLSEHPVKEVIRKVLKNDANKAMESAAHTQFDATLLCVEATSGTSTSAVTVTTTGSVASTNNIAMGNAHVKAIADEMKERDIPAYDGENYASLARTKTFRAFKDDLEAIGQYVETGFGKIMRGEIGRHYEGIRFFEHTSISSESWTNAKSDACYFFGEDTVMEGMVIPEEIRGKIPSDYGRSKGVAWYYIGGFKIVHNVTGAADNRIMKWDSAA